MSDATARQQRAELFFHDFPPGLSFVSEPVTVTAEAIVAFASEFDPQPFHLDAAAGEASLLGGLAASGWHTAALGMRLVYDTVLWRTASLGAPGIDEVRWRYPVRPGDTLTLRGRVAAARPSSSRPERGIVTFALELHNQNGVCVMSQANSIMVVVRADGQVAP